MPQRHHCKNWFSDDIAQAALFCLENNWLTGQTIGVDGGMSTIK